MLNQNTNRATQLLFNLIPLIGVAFWGWSAFALFYAFWLETLAIAFLNAIKILFARQTPSLWYAFTTSIKFFLFQGGILLFYFIFIIVFIAFEVKVAEDDHHFVYFLGLIDSSFRIAVLSMFGFKVMELIVVYFANGAFRYSKPTDFYYFFSGRMILIHVVIVLGFFTFTFFKNQLDSYYGVLAFTAVFVLAKMFLDYLTLPKAKNETTDMPYI